MKRWYALVVFAALLLSLMATMGGCSSEPVAFSEKLRDDKACYIDVVEIQPDFEDIFIYCKCILADGSEIWMEITDSNYKIYFNSETHTDGTFYMPNGVTYDTPVRLNGRAKRIDDVINNSGKKITVFRFDDADLSATSNSANLLHCSTPFSKDLNVGTFVVADITGISYTSSVKSTMSTESMSISGVFSVICACTLENGESINILIDISDYQKYFNESAKFDSQNSPDPIEFAQPVSIYGVVSNTRDEFGSLSLVQLEGNFFRFRSAVADDIEAAKVQNQPAVLFSDGLKEKQRVYTEIKSITAEYTVQNILSLISQEYYVCRCITTDNKEVWLYIFSDTYKKQFLEVYGDLENADATITLDTPLKINGVVSLADSICDDLFTKTGANTVIRFSEIA